MNNLNDSQIKLLRTMSDVYRGYFVVIHDDKICGVVRTRELAERMGKDMLGEQPFSVEVIETLISP